METASGGRKPPYQPTGLVLCGGGAKGAFQIGALEELQARGTLSHVRVMAGCSVGALNMVLMVLGSALNDVQLGTRVWMQLRREDLLSGQKGGGALFSRDGILRLMEMLPMERVAESPITLYVSIYHLAQGRVEFHRLNGLERDAICTLLLASSALPAAYAPIRYQDALYMDSGIVQEGNLCIEPLYQDGCRDILILGHDSEMYLDGIEKVKLMRGFGKTSLREKYADCTLTLLRPRKPLGGLFRGTLNFSPEAIAARMTQGAEDAVALLASQAGEPQDEDEQLVLMLRMLLPDAAAFAAFVSQCEKYFAKNLPSKTMDGKLWYFDIYAADGWRVQRHRVKGLRTHYRILDPTGVRRGWMLSREKLQQALEAFAPTPSEVNAQYRALHEEVLSLGRSSLPMAEKLERLTALTKQMQDLRDQLLT